MTFLDCLKNGDATNATALIETVLKQKTLALLNEHRTEIAKAAYGTTEVSTENK